MKTCVRCGESKPLELFPKNYRAKDGRKGACKTCQYAGQRAYLSTERGQQAKLRENLLSKYSLSIEQYQKLIETQNNLCGICGLPPASGKRLVVDHDHSCCAGYRSCGKCIRGLLCHECNTGIGYLKDDPARLSRAIKYLESHA